VSTDFRSQGVCLVVSTDFQSQGVFPADSCPDDSDCQFQEQEEW
jgi:hypothetical protein